MVVKRERKELSFPVPWGNIAGVAWGSPEHQRMFIVHGTMDNCDSFTRLIQQLPGDYYFVAIDLPGHGKSSHYPQALNLDFYNYVLAVRYVLDQLEWNSCIYIGHSFGAAIGIMFSIIFPNRIQRIVSLDILLPKIVPNDALVKRLKLINETTIFAMKKKETTLFTKEEVLDAFKKKRIFPLNQEAAETIFERATTKIDDFYKLTRDSRLRPLVFPFMNLEQTMECVELIDVPILLILAKESWFDVAKERDVLKLYQRKLMKYLTTVEVEGNHDVHNNNPEIVAPYISEFLNNKKSKL